MSKCMNISTHPKMWLGSFVMDTMWMLQLALLLYVDFGSTNGAPIELKGRILLHELGIEDTRQAHCFIMHLVQPNPVRIQLWSQQVNNTFKLEWERRVVPPANMGRVSLGLDSANVTNTHRLGVYADKEPCSLGVSKDTRPASVFSLEEFKTAPQLGQVVQTTDLYFPQKFIIAIHNYSDCSRVPAYNSEPVTVSGERRVPTKVPPATKQGPVVGASGTGIFSESVMWVVVVWLLVISLLLLALCLTFCCFYHRTKQVEQQINKTDSEKPEDWVVVVE